MTAPVSIIIPILNEAETLPELLAGLEGQTLLPQEIIFVDAGSTDGGMDLVLNWWRAIAWPGGDCRILSRPGAFPGAARNAGIVEAKGKWIAFLDGGIIPDPNWLASLFQYARKYNMKAVFGVCRFSGEGTFERAICALSYGQGAVRPVLPASLFAREVFTEVGLFPPDLLAAEDIVWVAQYSAVYGRKDVCPDAVVHYRHFPESWGSALRKWFVNSVNVAKSGTLHAQQAGYLFCFAITTLGIVRSPWAIVSVLPVYVVARGVLEPMRRSSPWQWWGKTNSSVAVSLGLAIALDAAKIAGFIVGNLMRVVHGFQGNDKPRRL